MANAVNISIDQRQIESLKAELSPRQLKSAMYQAVKRTTAYAARRVKDVVKRETYMRPKYIGRAIGSKVNGDPPVGVVTISHKFLPIVAFKYTASKKNGVWFQSGPKFPAVHFRRGFKARVRSAEQAAAGSAGHTGLFLRSHHLPTKGPNVGKGKLTREGIAGRFAIREIMGPSVLTIVSKNDVIAALDTDITTELAKNVQSQLDRFTK